MNNSNNLPLLLERIAHTSAEETLATINQVDLNNNKLSRQLVRTELELFEKAMKLQLEALSFASEHVSEWNKADQVVIAMACRVFNHLRSIAELLLLGYWAEALVLERSTYEAMTREWYYFKHPDKATIWFKGKDQLSQAIVDQALGAIEENDTTRTRILRNHYKFLSRRSHPNREAINLQTWDGENAIGGKAFLGGYINKEFFSIQFQSFLLTVSTATEMLGIVGLYKATETWKDECKELAKSIFILARNSVNSVRKA